MGLKFPLFDTSSFEHKKLLETDFPWQALDNLKEYVDQYPFKDPLELAHAHIENPDRVFVGEGTVIAHGVHIEGPAIIGKGCLLRPGSYIRPYSIIGDGCLIGHSSEVNRSILLNGAQLPHFNYAGDSIIGNRVNLGAGLILSNLRLDREEVFVKIDGERISTGRKKLGSIIGDDAHIGCNSVCNPGTIIGKSVCIGPCTSIKGVRLK